MMNKNLQLSSFGFYKKAHLIVKISEFKLFHGQENEIVSRDR